jgi:hypothetical protein
MKASAMPTRKTTTDKAEQLRQKINALQSKLKKTEALQTSLERKEDTRRCIIAGRYMLKHAEKNQSDPLTKKFLALLDEYLTPNERKTNLAQINKDRALFIHLGIAPLASNAETEDAAPRLTAEFKT